MQHFPSDLPVLGIGDVCFPGQYVSMRVGRERAQCCFSEFPPQAQYEVGAVEQIESRLVQHLAEACHAPAARAPRLTRHLQRLRLKQQAFVCVCPVAKLSRDVPVRKADLFHAGVVCNVFQITSKRDGSTRIVMRGLERCKAT